MAGNGPRPCGRHSIACRVADPLWTTTVSGLPEVWPQAVATVSVRASGTRTNAYIFVIWRPQSLDTTDAADSVGTGPVYPHKKTCAENQWSECRSSRLKR